MTTAEAYPRWDEGPFEENAKGRKVVQVGAFDTFLEWAQRELARFSAESDLARWGSEFSLNLLPEDAYHAVRPLYKGRLTELRGARA